jgi:hypothetical protein
LTNNTTNTAATQLILSDFELNVPKEPLSEEELLDYLSDAIAYMMEHRMDFLMSLLYRLDVAENKIAQAIMPGNDEPAHRALATAVLERQKQRMATKQAFREQNPSNWNWEMD